MRDVLVKDYLVLEYACSWVPNVDMSVGLMEEIWKVGISLVESGCVALFFWCHFRCCARVIHFTEANASPEAKGR
jgi:hypothetical protein